MVICFNFLSGKNRYHAVESGVTSLIPAVGNSWFKTRIFPSLLLTAIIDGRFFLVEQAVCQDLLVNGGRQVIDGNKEPLQFTDLYLQVKQIDGSQVVRVLGYGSVFPTHWLD